MKSVYDIMEKFGEIQPNLQTATLILGAIRGKDAFRRFRDTVDRIGLTNEWYLYQDQIVVDKARLWCERNDIDYELKKGT